MNALETLKASGTLHIVLTDKNGVVKEEQKFKNLVVTTGLGFIASRMKDATATVMSHMELGTSTAAASAGDTTLGAAISGSRTALTSTTVTTNSVAYVAIFGAGVGTGAVTEAGIFNASSAGTMLCRTVFAVINKQAADSMSVTWTVSVN